jgi:hypothetical protein
MMTGIPDDLIEQIYGGNTILFVGPGLSAGVGLPTWSEVLSRMIEWAVENGVDLGDEKKELVHLMEKGHFLIVVEALRSLMGDQLLKVFMLSVFRDSYPRPTPGHLIIPRIPFAAVLTTNYDTILENAYTLSKGVHQPVYTQSDIPALIDHQRNHQFYILKVHGDIDRFETVVLGERNYRQAMFMNRAYYEFLKNLFMTRTILFIGFSPEDLDLLLFLDGLRDLPGDYWRSHYALLNMTELSSIQRMRWEKNYGIRIIPYEATIGYSGIYEFLVELSQRFAKKVEFYSHETSENLFEDKILKRRNLRQKKRIIRKTHNRGQILKDKLARLECGPTRWREYEDLVIEIFEYLFVPPLRLPRIQKTSPDRLERRDALFPNTGTGSFWDYVRERYGSEFVVLEFKNSCGGIGRKEVDQMRIYMRKKSIGRFGFIVSRHPSTSSAIGERNNAYRDDDALILFIEDRILSIMIDRRIRDEDPADILDDLRFEFLSSVF